MLPAVSPRPEDAGFQFRRVDALPPLSWCADIRRGVRDAVVTHGRYVETTHDAFFEGVWVGPFVDFDFRSSYTTMGAGGCVEGERWCFVAPSHTYESLATLVATRLTRWQWHETLPVLYTFHWATTELAQRYADAIG